MSDWTVLFRLRLRLSVRALAALVLMLGGGLGWLAHSARVQREAVAAIGREGGVVAYNSVDQPKPSKEPKWLVGWLGVDYFDNVKAAHVGYRHTDAVMAHLAVSADWRN